MSFGIGVLVLLGEYPDMLIMLRPWKGRSVILVVISTSSREVSPTVWHTLLPLQAADANVDRFVMHGVESPDPTSGAKSHTSLTGLRSTVWPNSCHLHPGPGPLKSRF